MKRENKMRHAAEIHMTGKTISLTWGISEPLIVRIIGGCSFQKECL